MLFQHLGGPVTAYPLIHMCWEPMLRKKSFTVELRKLFLCLRVLLESQILKLSRWGILRKISCMRVFFRLLGDKRGL